MSTQGPGGQRKTTIGAIVVIAAIVIAVGYWYWDRANKSEMAADTGTETVVEETVVATEAPAAAESEAPMAEKTAAEAPAETAAADEKSPTASETPPKPGEAESTGYVFSPEHPYKVYPDGKFNFAVRRGYNMYHSICHVCHGFEARGSSFAPALKESLKYLSYEDFVTTVMNGRENITSSQTNVMPSFGENKTVVKYIDSLYAYLKARADGVLKPGDPPWEGPKTE